MFLLFGFGITALGVFVSPAIVFAGGCTTTIFGFITVAAGFAISGFIVTGFLAGLAIAETNGFTTAGTNDVETPCGCDFSIAPEPCSLSR